MDGITIQGLVLQLNTLLIGSRIEKIHQPDTRELVLTIRTRVSTYRLFISAHRQFPRIHFLTSRKPENPMRPPLFCVTLRKHAEGGRIIQVRQCGMDRIVEFEIEHQNEIGDRETFILIVELMGKNSNIILCRKETHDLRIVDAISHVTPDMSRFRSVLPGLVYIGPPALSKLPVINLAPENITLPNLSDLLAKENVQSLVKLIEGLGPVSAREVLFRVSSGNSSPAMTDLHLIQTAIVRELTEIFSNIANQTSCASLGLDNLNRPVECAPYELTFYERYKIVVSVSDAIEMCFEEKAVRISKTIISSSLVTSIETNLDKLRGKLSKIAQLETDSKDHDLLRIYGELLTAYPHLVTKGQSIVCLPNFYDDDNSVEIMLDPALTPNQNAQRYFKQSSKRKRSIGILAKEREQTEADMSYLENVLTYVEQAKEDMECLAQIRHELELEGFLKEEQRKSKQGKPRQGKSKSVTKANRSFDTRTSTDGFIIRIGHNNSENDRLTLKFSQPHDVWLHVKDIPGSHVVVEAASKTLSDTALEEAAMLAVFYSKAQNSSNVQVDFTEIRNVWKPNGARPGQVLYKHQKTRFVNPDRDRIERLAKRTQLELNR